MKMLFVVLLIAAGLIYAGTHGAFDRNFVTQKNIQNTESTDTVLTGKNSEQQHSSRLIETKKGLEATAAGEEAMDASTVHVLNDESNPYSATTQVGELAVLDSSLSSKTNQAPLSSQIDSSAQSTPSAVVSTNPVSVAPEVSQPQQILIPPLPPTLPTTVQSANDTDTLKKILDLIRSTLSGTDSEKIAATQVSNSQDKKLVTPADPASIQSDKNKETLTIILPVNKEHTTTNSVNGIVSISTNVETTSLLAVCKTKFPSTVDVRVVHQTTLFNSATQNIESLSYEVECL